MAKPPPELINLTEALTLAAFGIEKTGEEFAREMRSTSFGLEYEESQRVFLKTLKVLLGQVIIGNFELVGKFSTSLDGEPEALTDTIPANALHNFAAFDYKINGFRHGSPQLLWFPRGLSAEYTQPIFARAEHYREISVERRQIIKFLKIGSCPAKKVAKKPSLPEAQLRRWWENLTPQEQKASKKYLVQLAKDSHPEHEVVRQRVRDIIGSRPRGRPKSAAK